MRPRAGAAVRRMMAVLGALALAGAVACGGRTDAEPLRGAAASLDRAPAAEFAVDTAVVDVPLELPAQLYVEHDAVVVARSAGTVDSIFVELGDAVRGGALLARLESADQEIALAAAQAASDNLGRSAERVRALTRSGGATPADSEQVEFQLRQAEIAKRKALRDVELTRVTAPFDGVVVSRRVRPRRFVAVGDTLFRVAEPAPLFARVRVPEGSAGTARIGERATVSGVSGSRSEASVVQAAPIIDAASGTREIVLRVSHPHGELVAGASVVVRLGRAKRTVVAAPREAIAAEGYALVVENGHSTVRPVTVGARIDGGRVEIVSGLAPGERLARPPR